MRHLLLNAMVLLLFMPACSGGSTDGQGDEDANRGGVTDVDGNSYRVVSIGTQTWMAEDLDTTQLSDGDSIPLVSDASWTSLSTPAYCRNEGAADIYGALYNWYAVDTGRLCPSGWHVPTTADWAVLIEYLGGEDVAGGKLKETGTAHWESPNTDASDEVGFAGLPGGYRSRLGWYEPVGQTGMWWSATETEAGEGWKHYASSSGARLYGEEGSKLAGMSVRCIRD